jgi:hypothetical protein
VKVALLCALLVAAPEEPASPATGGARRAQHSTEEPTPFWLTAPPPKQEKPSQKKKPAKPKPQAPTPEDEPPPKPPPAKKKHQKKPQIPEEQVAMPVPWQKPAPPPPEQPAQVAAPPPPTAVVPARQPPPLPAPEPAPDLPARTPSAPIVETRAPRAELVPAPAREVRHISIDLLAGLWSRTLSDGSGSTSDFGYGLRGGYALLDGRVEADLLAIRTSANEGSPFLSTTLAHDLIELRGFYVLGDQFAVLAGAGGGVAIAQTHYSIVDPVASSSSTLEATAYKAVASATVAGRARLWGFEGRIEVSLLLRDGRLEPFALGGLGYAFW